MVFSKLHFISFSFLLSLPFYSNSLALNGHKKELSVRMTKEPQQEFDEETASFVSQGICRAYITKDTSVINKGLSTCYNKCGQQARNDNAVHSVTCLSGGPSVDSYLDPDGNQFTDGRCECDIPILDQTVNDLVLSLPAIAEIGCELIFGALDAVLEAGVAAIPGVGEMTAGMEGAVQTAKTVLMNGKDANDFLQWFAKPCGSSNYTKMVDKIFDPLSGVPDSVLPGLGCKGNPCPGPPLKSPPPSSAPPSSTPSSSTPSSTSYPPGTTNGTAPSSAVSATTTIIAMSVSPTASSDPVCTAPDSTDGPSPTDPPPSRDDDKKKRTPPNTANCFVFNANQPQAPPSGQIPSFMTCRNKNGEANIYTSEYIAAVIQQGARYKLGNQLATSKRCRFSLLVASCSIQFISKILASSFTKGSRHPPSRPSAPSHFIC